MFAIWLSNTTLSNTITSHNFCRDVQDQDFVNQNVHSTLQQSLDRHLTTLVVFLNVRYTFDTVLYIALFPFKERKIHCNAFEILSGSVASPERPCDVIMNCEKLSNVTFF